MKGLHWYIARRYLGGRRSGLLSLITWIALGSVTVGVMALVVVNAVMTGMQEDLRGKILESSPHVTILERSSSLRVLDWQTVLDSVLVVDGVVGAAPFVLSQVSLVRGDDESGLYSQPANFFGVLIDTRYGAASAPWSEQCARRIGRWPHSHVLSRLSGG